MFSEVSTDFSDCTLLAKTVFVLALSRVFMDVIAYAILQSLDPDLPLIDGDFTVKSMLLRHCAFSTEVMVRYFRTWTGRECSGMVIVGPLNTASILIPVLHDQQAQALFTAQCNLMQIVARNMPLARYIMQGWQALLWSIKKEIPVSALPYFQNTGEEMARLKDLPASLMLIPRYDMRDFLEVDGEGADKIEPELGLLLAKWSALSVI